MATREVISDYMKSTSSYRIVVLLLIVSIFGIQYNCAWGVEALPPEDPTNIPDPYGLGERLALIDYFQKNKIPYPINGTLEAYREIYWGPIHDRQYLVDKAIEEDKDRQKRIKESEDILRLDSERADKRNLLKSRYVIDIPEDVTLDELQKIEQEREPKIINEIGAPNQSSITDVFSVEKRMLMMEDGFGMLKWGNECSDIPSAVRKVDVFMDALKKYSDSISQMLVTTNNGPHGFTVAFEQNRYLMGHDHAADIHVTA